MLAVHYALQDVDVFHLESASAGAAARQPSPRQILHEVEWTQRDGLPSRSRRRLVGLGRLELPTSPLSGARSSHLSYRPTAGKLPALDFTILACPSKEPYSGSAHELSVAPDGENSCACD